MVKNKKLCFGCNELKYIWKCVDGKKYCKECNNKLKAPKIIAKVSKKRIEQDKEYNKLRLKLLSEKSYCEVKSTNCTILSTDCHHKKGRIGKNYLDYSTFLSVCRNCHLELELNPNKAKELGFSENRLD